MNIFNEVKERLDMRSVAAYYGFEPDRSGYIRCPFHTEKTPSMKLYDNGCHCFGCGAHTDVTGFVMKLYDLSAIDAARKLNADFALGLDFASGRDFKPKNRAVTMSQLMKCWSEWEKNAFRVLNGYYKLLTVWSESAPESPDAEPHPLWVRACRELPLIDHWCMTLIQGGDEERKRFYIEHRKEVGEVEAEYRKYVRE